MKVSILGVGDLSKIPRHAKTSKKELEKLILDLAEFLANKEYEIIIVPDRGIPFELAKIYKNAGGKKVYGLVPTKDKIYKKDISQYLKVIDEKIKFDTWRDISSEIIASGDICIIIGLSPGIMREVSAFKYKMKYHNSKTKLIWFRDTISSPIHPEIEEEIPITYVNSVKELEKII